jgi:8-hydroxy-5-deazaflavin:NADPH oxidoreductase
VVGGRSSVKARELATRLGGGARAATVSEAVVGTDAALLAVPWTGVADVLNSIGAPSGTLAGVTLIDPTNAVEHGGGALYRWSEPWFATPVPDRSCWVRWKGLVSWKKRRGS